MRLLPQLASPLPPRHGLSSGRARHRVAWANLGSPPLLAGSVQFSCSVMPDSLRPHGLQHTRPPCPSPTPRAYSDSCQLSWWCHPTISSSVVPFSCLQPFPASGSFSMSQFFESGSPSIGSFSFSISPSNEYSGLISFRMNWFDLLAVQFQENLPGLSLI